MTHTNPTDRQYATALEAAHLATQTTDFYDKGDATPLRHKYRLIHSMVRCDRRERMVEADNKMGDPRP